MKRLYFRAVLESADDGTATVNVKPTATRNSSYPIIGIPFDFRRVICMVVIPIKHDESFTRLMQNDSFLQALESKLQQALIEAGHTIIR